jgi:hypothetical protein
VRAKTDRKNGDTGVRGKGTAEVAAEGNRAEAEGEAGTSEEMGRRREETQAKREKVHDEMQRYGWPRRPWKRKKKS